MIGTAVLQYPSYICNKQSGQGNIGYSERSEQFCKLTVKLHLHEVGLGLFHTSHISEGDAGVGLHLELGFALAEVHGVVASWATHAAPLATGQQEQASHQQQWECKVACTQAKSATDSIMLRMSWWLAGWTCVQTMQLEDTL